MLYCPVPTGCLTPTAAVKDCVVDSVLCRAVVKLTSRVTIGD